MLSDTLWGGSFHNRSMTMGGSRARQARTVQPNGDVTRTAAPAAHIARTQMAAQAIFLCLSCMMRVYRHSQAKSVQQCTVRGHHCFSLSTLRASVAYAAARARRAFAHEIRSLCGWEQRRTGRVRYSEWRPVPSSMTSACNQMQFLSSPIAAPMRCGSCSAREDGTASLRKRTEAGPMNAAGDSLHFASRGGGNEKRRGGSTGHLLVLEASTPPVIELMGAPL